MNRIKFNGLKQKKNYKPDSTIFICQSSLETKFGTFTTSLYRNRFNLTEECLVLTSKHYHELPLIRIHSACLFGESFLSLECDCQSQLHKALSMINQRSGAVLYLFQEGRGIGLEGKIKAMSLEKTKNCNSYEAYSLLGYPIDNRDYSFAVNVMENLKIPKNIILLTQNRDKKVAVKNGGFNLHKLR